MSTPQEPRGGIQFRDRSEILDFLLEVATVIGETLDLDRLLGHVADMVQRIIPSQLFAIMLYSERRKALRIRYAVGHRTELVENLLLPLGEGITGIAALKQEPILVRDVRRDPRYVPAMDSVRSELAVPMVARGKLVGIIDLQSMQPDAYTEADKILVSLIASRVASAIDNARLYHRLEQQHRTLRTLSRISQEFSSILDLDELLRKLAELIHTLISFDAFGIYLLDESRQVLVSRFNIRFDQEIYPDEIPVGKGITGTAVQLRQPVRSEDTSRDPRYIEASPGIRSEVAVPLMLRDRVVGVVNLESQRLNHFSLDHQRALTLLAPQIASAVENARLYELIAEREKRLDDDLRAARNLQSVLLPNEAPELEGLEIAVHVRPAREISGDLYEFIDYNNGECGIFFGDSSGKGAAAALYGAVVIGLIRSIGRRRFSPGETLRRLNEVMVERRVDAQYATLLAMHWNSARKQLTVANAGGTPPLIFRGEQILDLKAEGVPVGLLEERQYEETMVHVQSGDIILLASDGVFDALNVKVKEFGRRRLVEAVRAHASESAQQIVDAIFAAVSKFTGKAPQFDDQTVIVLCVK